MMHRSIPSKNFLIHWSIQVGMIDVFDHSSIKIVRIQSKSFSFFHRSFHAISEACNVTMTIHINTISAINEVNMVSLMISWISWVFGWLFKDYNTDLIFRQSWYDPRLNYSGTEWATKSPQITLHYSLIDRIWVPDSFFRNAKEGKRSDITVPNRLIRIHRDGKVLYSQRFVDFFNEIMRSLANHLCHFFSDFYLNLIVKWNYKNFLWIIKPVWWTSAVVSIFICHCWTISTTFSRCIRNQWSGIFLGWNSQCQCHSCEWRSGNARFRSK